MAFERPTLAKLVRRAKADIETRLTGADANLSGSPEEALAVAGAGLAHGLHGHIKWATRQVLTDLSEEEFLLRDGDVHGVARIDAVKATGTLTITGTNASVCLAGTIWVRGDGVEYEQDADGTISGGQAEVALTAVVAGSDGDAVAGTTLQIASPETGITAAATVSGGGITGGADIESVEDYRARVLLRKRTPPKGGGPGDYETWAREVSGVTRAWEAPLQLGPGTVVVYFVRDDDVAIVPDAGEIAAVQAHIDAKSPVTADVTVAAPTDSPLPFTFSNITPDTAQVKAAVEAELEALLYNAAAPNEATTIRISQIREAISIATGETDHVLASPAADIVVPVGTIRTLGVVTWP